jgi:hypothetical protein
LFSLFFDIALSNIIVITIGISFVILGLCRFAIKLDALYLFSISISAFLFAVADLINIFQKRIAIILMVLAISVLIILPHIRIVDNNTYTLMSDVVTIIALGTNIITIGLKSFFED